jgi:hypothetical protein
MSPIPTYYPPRVDCVTDTLLDRRKRKVVVKGGAAMLFISHFISSTRLGNTELNIRNARRTNEDFSMDIIHK